MSDANQDHGGVAVERQGVELRKAVDAEDFGVPSLVFTVHAPADEGATIRIRDPLPDAVDGGDIGFHPNHGGEFWTYEGDAVVFTRRFEPGETYTTVYGIAGVDPAADDWLMAEPSVEVVESDGTDGQEADDEAGPEPTEGPTVADIADAEPERREAVPDDRLDRLRRDVDELTASVESLEARAGVAGAGSEDPNSVADEVESIRDRVADLEATVDSSRVRASSASAEVEELSESVESIREETDELAADLREATDGVGRNSRDIDDIGAEVAELATTVDTLAAELQADEDEDRIAALEDEVEAMRDDLESVLAFQERLVASLEDVDAG